MRGLLRRDGHRRPGRLLPGSQRLPERYLLGRAHVQEDTALDVLTSSEMATFLSFLSTKEKQEVFNIEYISGIKRGFRIVLPYI